MLYTEMAAVCSEMHKHNEQTQIFVLNLAVHKFGGV
jgi:hypothetical protein